MNPWRDECALLEEKKIVNGVCLRPSRDGVQFRPGAFVDLLLKMGESFNLVFPNNGLALDTLEKNACFVQVLHSYISWQQVRLHDHFEHVMVRSERQTAHWIANFYNVQDINTRRSVSVFRHR